MSEGNKLVDYLENHSINKVNCRYTSFWGMETIGKKLINSDKMKCPYLRVLPSKEWNGEGGYNIVFSQS